MILAAIPDGSRFGAANVRLLGAPMTTGDIEAAIADQNSGKSSDPHGMCAEVYKHCSDAWAPLREQRRCIADTSPSLCI